MADLLLLGSCLSEEGALQNRGSAVSCPPQFIHFFSFSFFSFFFFLIRNIWPWLGTMTG